MRIHVLEVLSRAGAIGGLNNSAGSVWEGFGARDVGQLAHTKGVPMFSERLVSQSSKD